MKLTALVLDGLHPGMTVEQALTNPKWTKEDENLLASREYGRPDIGFPFSCANIEGTRIMTITGKSLSSLDTALSVEVGLDWAEVRRSFGLVPGQRVVYDEDANLSLVLAYSDGFLHAIQLGFRDS